MKSLYIAILMLYLPLFCQGQNVSLTIGRGTDCFGRGACSITTENSNNYNADVIRMANGKTILRIYRNKLSLEESHRVLGEPITEKNKTTLQFVMENAISLTHDVKQLISQAPSEQPAMLEARNYPTKITDEYIDITIINE
jgi:hypothetical protein